jgi:hypothetical protein
MIEGLIAELDEHFFRCDKAQHRVPQYLMVTGVIMIVLVRGTPRDVAAR